MEKFARDVLVVNCSLEVFHSRTECKEIVLFQLLDINSCTLSRNWINVIGEVLEVMSFRLRYAIQDESQISSDKYIDKVNW